MKWIRQHWIKILIGLLLIVAPAPWLAVQWAGSEIASPPRRTLMEYHHEHLNHQGKYGIHIDSFTASDGTPCLVVIPSGNPGERGKKIRAQLAERQIPLSGFGDITGTLVLTHGRKGRKEDYLPIAERLCAVGFRCVIPDLPAHGDHPGKFATYGLREAALPARVLDEASKKLGFSPQPAGLMGMSMGGSVAIHSAAEPEAPWKALVVIASFDSFSAVIQNQATRHAGANLGPWWAQATAAIYQKQTGIALHDIQPHSRAASIRIPTLVAHGSDDMVATLAAGRRLFDAIPASTRKQWIEIPDSGHDNVLITPYPIYSEIAAWMVQHVPKH